MRQIAGSTAEARKRVPTGTAISADAVDSIATAFSGTLARGLLGRRTTTTITNRSLSGRALRAKFGVLLQHDLHHIGKPGHIARELFQLLVGHRTGVESPPKQIEGGCGDGSFGVVRGRRESGLSLQESEGFSRAARDREAVRFRQRLSACDTLRNGDPGRRTRPSEIRQGLGVDFPPIGTELRS